MAVCLFCCRNIVLYIYRKLNKDIATIKLHIDALKERFKDEKSFRIIDVAAFYREYEPNLKQNTIHWRIYALVQMGILNRIGRGKFEIGERKNYIPEISSKLKTIDSKLKKIFPYLKFCIWQTSALNEFMLHQSGNFYVLVEVDKEATQSVFYFLKETNHSVFIDPTNDLLDKYLPFNKVSLIVKPLVTEAPIQNIKGINTTSLEKILVDIFCDDVIFSAQQGSEMRTIFKEAFSKYTINENRMFRYADRRGKKENFKDYLNSITNLRQ